MSAKAVLTITVEIPEQNLPPGTNQERFQAACEREMRLIASALARRAWAAQREENP